MFLKLIRGLPGSGKSTLARVLSQVTKCKHFEADMFFTKKDGSYKFDIKRIGLAHAWCIKKTGDALSKGNSVVVSNVFISEGDMLPYMSLAKQHDADFDVIEAKGAWKSIHGIPSDRFKLMKMSWALHNPPWRKHV